MRRRDGGGLRRCTDADFDAIHRIINGGAEAYRGVIPADRWHEPYMSCDQLRDEIAAGVEFWGIEADGSLQAVMGVQDRGEVALIRHAYVLTACQREGLGTRLLGALEAGAGKPILVGTWAAATWAIEFYRRNGYRQLDTAQTHRLLRRYWNIPGRQVETSVVLAGPGWEDAPCG